MSGDSPSSAKKRKKSKKEKRSKKSKVKSVGDSGSNGVDETRVLDDASEAMSDGVVNAASTRLQKALKNPDNELWIIRAPMSFRGELLNKHKLRFNGKAEIVDEKGSGAPRSYKVEEEKVSQRAQLVCFVPGEAGKVVPQKPFLKQINIIDEILIPEAPAQKRLSMAYKGVAQKESLPYRLKLAGNTSKSNVVQSTSVTKRKRDAVDTVEGSVKKKKKKGKKEKKSKKSKWFVSDRDGMVCYNETLSLVKDKIYTYSTHTYFVYFLKIVVLGA